MGKPYRIVELAEKMIRLCGLEPGVDISIEFSGMGRESAELGAMPFREVWMLARQQPESDWRLARRVGPTLQLEAGTGRSTDHRQPRDRRDLRSGAAVLSL